MKKYLIAAVTVAAFAGMSFAQAPAAPAQKPADAPKVEAPKAVKKAAPKHEVVKLDTVNGAITAIDAVANTITVTDEKAVAKVLTIDAKKLATLKVGDNVKIKAKDNKVVVIKTIKEHKGKKVEKK
jgi:hypothetical protein